MESPAPQPPRLLDRVRMTLRARHGSRRTEKAYVAWIRRFILFHGKRHPSTMGGAEVTQFLSALAVQRNVAASTQNQALSALLFLYRDVLGQDLPWLDDVVRAKRPTLIPVVLSRREVHGIIGSIDGPLRLLVLLLYGSGLRLLEALRLRVKDVDFARNQITVRGGKGDRDRATMLPAALALDLAKHLDTVRDLHEADLRAGAGWVSAAATTCTNRSCNARSKPPYAVTASPSAPPAIPSGIRSPPTCSRDRKSTRLNSSH